MKINNPIDAIRCGIGYVPEDRKGAGAVLGMSIKENITLASLKKIIPDVYQWEQGDGGG